MGIACEFTVFFGWFEASDDVGPSVENPIDTFEGSEKGDDGSVNGFVPVEEGVVVGVTVAIDTITVGFVVAIEGLAVGVAVGFLVRRNVGLFVGLGVGDLVGP